MFIIYYHLCTLGLRFIGFRVLDVLDSMDSTCISTLCLSSLLYRCTRLRGNPKSSKFTSRSHALPRQSPQRVATSPRVRTLDHANPRKRLRGNPAGTPKVASLPRVQSLDHTNPRRGLRGAPKSCNFTSRSVARPRQSIVRVAMLAKMCNFTSRSRVRPRQSMGRVARDADKVQLYLAFARSTTPIHGNFRLVTPNSWKKMQFYLTFARSTMPIQSMGRVACHAEKLQLYLAFARSTTPIHGKGCVSRRTVGKKMQLYLAFARSTTPIHGKLRVTPKSCNFTSRSRVRPRPYLAFARSTTPIHGKGCIPDRWHGAGSGFRKNI